eukprot:m.27783 g.27783  ORF g.27783 m.27783 type:complete len:455 (+) comp15808_c1_seq1:137-1501(+)
MSTLQIDLDSTAANVTEWLIRNAKVPFDIVEEFRGVTGQEILGFTADELAFSGMDRDLAGKVYKRLRGEEDTTGNNSSSPTIATDTNDTSANKSPKASAPREYHDPRDELLSDDAKELLQEKSENLDKSEESADEFPSDEALEEEMFYDYEVEEIRDLDREAELLWPSSQADWVSLTNEMWVNVFSLVEFWTLAMAITRVCRKFKMICKELIVTNIDLRLFPQNRITDAALENLANRFFSVQSLSLNGYKNITLDCVNGIGEESRQRLKVLDLSSKREVDDKWLETIGRGFPQLESLYLSSCGLISRKGLGAISDGCTNLKTLDMGWCIKVDDDALTHLAHCTKLRKINLHGCTLITDTGLEVLTKGCKGLIALDLKMCDNITDDGIRAVVASCRFLKKLGLYGVNKVTNVGLRAIAHGLPHLMELNIRFCTEVTEEGTDSIRELIPQCDIKTY